jgi:predicted permease
LRRVLLWLERGWHDLKHTARLIVRAPAFAAIAVVSIAFGTGANIAIFSVADMLLLRPLPVDDWSGLVTVGSRIRREVSTFVWSSYPDYVDIRGQAKSFTDLTAFTTTLMGLRPTPEAAPQVRLSSVVSSNYFDVLGVRLAHGRTFRAEEDTEGQPPTVILGHHVWQSMLGGDADVVGRIVRVGGIDCTVVGVAPAEFWGLNQRYIPEAAFLPIGLWPRLANAGTTNPLRSRDQIGFIVKGRLRDGVTRDDAQNELDVIGAGLAARYPGTNAGRNLVVQTELEVKRGADPFSTGALFLLSTLSIAVLAVACANVTGLLASRAPARAREIALRLAIGASRTRVVRQLMTESVVIALGGAAGGLLVGYAGISLLGQIRYPSEVVAMPEARIDERTFMVALLLAMASALLFGLLPALQAVRTNLIQPLKAGDAPPTRGVRLTARHALVVLQVALSLVLVTIAVFTSQAFERIFGDGPGFRVTGMAKLSIDPGQAGFDAETSVRYFERVLADVRGRTAATAVGLTSAMPLFSFEMTEVTPDGVADGDARRGTPSVANRIDEGYFAAMEIPVLAGRAFAPSDTAGMPPVAIINDTLATQFWPGDDPIGRRLRTAARPDVPVEIVGVVRTSKYWFPGEHPQRAIYFPFRQQPATRMSLLAAAPGESVALVGPVRDVVRGIDADVPVFDAHTIEEYYDARATSFGGILLRLVTAMGAMGMILTATGLYGLVSYAASRRTREIGIRVAIGATPRRVLTMILRQGLSPAWIGAAAGAALSLATAQWLGAHVPVAFAYEPLALALIVPALIGVTAAAAWIPARRASRIAPTEALRCE